MKCPARVSKYIKEQPDQYFDGLERWYLAQIEEYLKNCKKKHGFLMISFQGRKLFTEVWYTALHIQKRSDGNINV